MKSYSLIRPSGFQISRHVSSLKIGADGNRLGNCGGLALQRAAPQILHLPDHAP
jgi:hypothetical protein